MSPIGRRNLLCLLALSAVPPLTPLSAASGSGNRTGPLTVPDHPVLLRRVLERELNGNAMLVVTRDWSVQFEQGPRGILVTGNQTAVTVDAPRHLAALADIERKREVTGLFPMTLGSDGRIALAGMTRASTAALSAIDVAAEILRKVQLAGTAAQDARQFLSQIGATAAEQVSTLPPDLFFPQPGESRYTRDLPASGGEAGSLEVEIDAQLQPNSALLARFERRIVTHVGPSSRTARECWILSA